MFRAEHLTKRYADVVAVDGVDLEVRPGEIFGLLGSNGAGKTTMMKVFMTLLRSDGGRAFVDGIDVTRDPLKVRAALGYVPENPSLYEKLTGAEFLALLATLRGLATAIVAVAVYSWWLVPIIIGIVVVGRIAGVRRMRRPKQ